MTKFDPNYIFKRPEVIAAKARKIQSHLSMAWEAGGARGVISAVWTRSGGLSGIFIAAWTRFWMLFAGLRYFGRVATWVATLFAPPYFRHHDLTFFNRKGYIAPSATIHHKNLRLGANVGINDRAIIFQDTNGGPIELGDRVFIHSDAVIQTGEGGSVRIGNDTHVHPRCQLSAYMSPIQIGSNVLIAPNCAFYPYDHAKEPGKPIRHQGFVTKGGIFIDNDSWLGFGVIVLDGVRIGKGAVVGAGAVVTTDVPDGAIAVGNPARVVKMRTDLSHKSTKDVNNENH